jgi:ATP-dependent 26S proteasome regulatory subunit
VLLDGVEERGPIYVLATTKRPEHVDVALLRPGHFDQPRRCPWPTLLAKFTLVVGRTVVGTKEDISTRT